MGDEEGNDLAKEREQEEFKPDELEKEVDCAMRWIWKTLKGRYRRLIE